MQINITPSEFSAIDLAAKSDARATWLDQVLDQLGAARRSTEMLGLPDLSQRIAQAEADANRLRRR